MLADTRDRPREPSPPAGTGSDAIRDGSEAGSDVDRHSTDGSGPGPGRGAQSAGTGTTAASSTRISDTEIRVGSSPYRAAMTAR